SASAKVICFIGKLGQRDRRISPDSGSLFQTILSRGQNAVSASIAGSEGYREVHFGWLRNLYFCVFDDGTLIECLCVAAQLSEAD
ncbi:hypothetical protein, partial [Stutzerimonas stutzeri]|uniref:hypothetical protein n=1 Tax=Stutzerimonas stutzeri TaxID=316 RepID=UPI00371701F4